MEALRVDYIRKRAVSKYPVLHTKTSGRWRTIQTRRFGTGGFGYHVNLIKPNQTKPNPTQPNLTKRPVPKCPVAIVVPPTGRFHHIPFADDIINSRTGLNGTDIQNSLH